MLAHQSNTSPQKKLTLTLLIAITLMTVALGLGVRWLAVSSGLDRPASYFKVNHQVDQPSQTSTLRK